MMVGNRRLSLAGVPESPNILQDATNQHHTYTPPGSCSPLDRPKGLLGTKYLDEPSMGIHITGSRGADPYGRRGHENDASGSPIPTLPDATFDVPSSRPRRHSTAFELNNPDSGSNFGATGERVAGDDQSGGAPGTSTAGNRIRVYVRLRPMSTKEKQAGAVPCVDVVEGKEVYLTDCCDETDYLKKKRMQTAPSRRFTFDAAFPEQAPQEEVYRVSTAGLISSVLEGHNCSVFAYGATGAGKTYTMLGTEENPGVMALALKDLFHQLEAQCVGGDYSVNLSYLEVYNEMVRDLLASGRPLAVREDGRQGIVAAGLTQVSASTAKEVMRLLQQGNANRQTEPTRCNETSSRSHAILQVVVEFTVGSMRRIGKLSLIDLAGSERALATEQRTLRSMEGANINRSLLALSSCIHALVEGRRHVPYRNSKLTQLLRDSLGGFCRTAMITNISPCLAVLGETQNSLHWADRAKEIRTKASENAPTHLAALGDPARVAMLEAENSRLKAQVSQLQKRMAEQAGRSPSCPPRLTSRTSDRQLSEARATIERQQEKIDVLQERLEGVMAMQQAAREATSGQVSPLGGGGGEDDGNIVERLRIQVCDLQWELELARKGIVLSPPGSPPDEAAGREAGTNRAAVIAHPGESPLAVRPTMQAWGGGGEKVGAEEAEPVEQGELVVQLRQRLDDREQELQLLRQRQVKDLESLARQYNVALQTKESFIRKLMKECADAQTSRPPSRVPLRQPALPSSRPTTPGKKPVATTGPARGTTAPTSTATKGLVAAAATRRPVAPRRRMSEIPGAGSQALITPAISGWGGGGGGGGGGRAGVMAVRGGQTEEEAESIAARVKRARRLSQLPAVPTGGLTTRPGGLLFGSGLRSGSPDKSPGSVRKRAFGDMCAVKATPLWRPGGGKGPSEKRHGTPSMLLQPGFARGSRA